MFYDHCRRFCRCHCLLFVFIFPRYAEPGVFGNDIANLSHRAARRGKTTIGHALARARHYQFTDTDHALQEREQRTVATIVEQEGWARFRELESEALKAATRPETVVATGGGIILAEVNRQFMRENGVVIYLQVPVSALIARLEAYPKTEQRPTLTGKPVRDEVGEVLARGSAVSRNRASYYRCHRDAG